MGRTHDPVMSEPSEGARVGVVGDRPAVAEAVEAAGGVVYVDEPASVASSDLTAVVAGGEAALLDLVPHAPDVPVLPVGAGRGTRSVPPGEVGPAVERLIAGDYESLALPILSANSPFQGVRALCDLMLATSDPAHISEFTVRSGGDRVARFRADGVVVATPTGSHGYARAADGPIVAPGTGVGPVVPVAPFATDQDRWVLPLDGIELRVERDESPVELLADDRRVGPVASNVPVEITVEDSFSVAVVAESRGFYSVE